MSAHGTILPAPGALELRHPSGREQLAALGRPIEMVSFWLVRPSAFDQGDGEQNGNQSPAPDYFGQRVHARE